jgi:hypothetical protein
VGWIKAKVIHHIPEVFEQGVDLDAHLAGAAKLERAANVVTLAGVHVRFELVPLLLKLSHVKLGKLRLRIKSIDMAWTALHQEKDAAFRFGRMVRLLRLHGAFG